MVYDTPVLDLLTTTNGRVQGVRAQTPEGLMDIHAGAVILACGGEGPATSGGRVTWEQTGKRSMSGHSAQHRGIVGPARGAGRSVRRPPGRRPRRASGRRFARVGDLNLGDLTARLSYPLASWSTRTPAL